MKKLTAYLLLLFVLILGITGCSGDSDKTNGDDKATDTSDLEVTTEDNNSGDVAIDTQSAEIIFFYDELDDGTICITDYETTAVPEVFEIPAEYEGKTVTEIENIFNGDAQVKKVVLPETLRVIGKRSFSEASALEELVINGAVERIEKEAIYMCDKLTKLEFKDGLKVSEGYGIYLCPNLSEVHLPGTVEDLTEQGNFGGCAADLTLYGPAGSFVEQYAKDCNFNFVAE